MIDKNAVKTIVEEWLEGNEYFLVDVSIEPDNRIVVEIDHADGVWIEDCAELSRHLQERLGAELDDYELEVGSACYFNFFHFIVPSLNVSAGAPR